MIQAKVRCDLMSAGPLSKTGSDGAPRPDMTVHLLLDSRCAVVSAQPVTVGLPLAKGWLTEGKGLTLRDAADNTVAVQTTPLAPWPDGSVKWLLVDFVVPTL